MRHDPAATQIIMIDGRQGYDLGLAEGALRLLQYDQTARILSLRRIGHIILRHPRSPVLRALLELAARGVPVHFQDGAGRIGASLIASQPDSPPEVTEWVHDIQQIDPRPRYQEWLSLQLRHAASRILRQSPAGSIEAFERNLLRYAARGTTSAIFESTWNEIRALNWCWIDGELTRQRLRPLADALAARDHALLHDLDRVLSIPLLWKLTPWLRIHHRHHPRERMAFFARQRCMLETRLALALSALRHHLGSQPPQLPTRTLRRPRPRVNGAYPVRWRQRKVRST